MRKVTIPQALTILKRLYPSAGCTLDWSTPLELLVATILSAQCTDVRVNMVTKKLFRKYKTPQDYVKVSQEELERDIFSCGTYRMKAKAIQESCRIIIDEFDGEVPRTMEGMLKLRGVGRKTASIVLGTVFGIIEGVPVDTHVMRVSQRQGLTTFKDQARIEKDLMKKTPQEDWLNLSHLLIAHGRTVCKARGHKCDQCLFRNEHPERSSKL